jgi:pimeloyl-ACP methyl ester carboxylesterase
MRSILISLFILSYSQSFGQTTTPEPLRYFMQAGPSPANEIQYGNNPEAGHYIKAGDAKIYYEIYGKGQPLVMLHGGILGATYDFAQLIDSLSKRFQVIAISTRGHGKSELGNTPFSYKQRANDALAVIKAVTRDSVIVFGFSDGGYTGYELAGMYPERIKKLIVMGASERNPSMSFKLNFTVDAAFKMDSVFINQQRSLMPEPQRLNEVFSSVSDYYNHHLVVDSALFSAIRCPVLIMAGDHDPFNSVQQVVNASKMLRGSALAIIPNTSHGAFQENFPAVWACIIPFLNHQ